MRKWFQEASAANLHHVRTSTMLVLGGISGSLSGKRSHERSRARFPSTMKPHPRKKKPKFSLAHKDDPMAELVKATDKRTLAIWATDCAERLMPCFEKQSPEDPRPREALDALQAWIVTGAFSMAVIRKASLSAHAAAREVGEDNAARSAARAAGQAVATAHVKTHALGAALYARQAMFRCTDPADAEAAAVRERDWQYRHLLELNEKSGPEK